MYQDDNRMDLKNFLDTYNSLVSWAGDFSKEQILLIKEWNINISSEEWRTVSADIKRNVASNDSNKVDNLAFVVQRFHYSACILHKSGHYQIFKALKSDPIATINSLRNKTYPVTFGEFRKNPDYIRYNFTDYREYDINLLYEIIDNATSVLDRISIIEQSYAMESESNELPC